MSSCLPKQLSPKLFDPKLSFAQAQISNCQSLVVDRQEPVCEMLLSLSRANLQDYVVQECPLIENVVCSNVEMIKGGRTIFGGTLSRHANPTVIERERQSGIADQSIMHATVGGKRSVAPFLPC